MTRFFYTTDFLTFPLLYFQTEEILSLIHIDVYKRQLPVYVHAGNYREEAEGGRNRLLYPCLLYTSGFFTEDVSQKRYHELCMYFLIDVYKRQRVSCRRSVQAGVL